MNIVYFGERCVLCRDAPKYRIRWKTRMDPTIQCNKVCERDLKNLKYLRDVTVVEVEPITSMEV